MNKGTDNLSSIITKITEDKGKTILELDREICYPLLDAGYWPGDIEQIVETINSVSQDIEITFDEPLDLSRVPF